MNTIRSTSDFLLCLVWGVCLVTAWAFGLRSLSRDLAECQKEDRS